MPDVKTFFISFGYEDNLLCTCFEDDRNVNLGCGTELRLWTVLRDRIKIIESGNMKLCDLRREESNDELFFGTGIGQR